jgi:hypothetical protein
LGSADLGRLKEDRRCCGDSTGTRGQFGTFGEEFSFIEHYIAGKIDFLRLRFKATVTMLIGSVAKEYAGFTSKGQFV